MSSSAATTLSPAPPAPPAEAPPVIEIQNLVKSFSGRNVVDGLSLTVKRGETLVIMGASGCGKSTLLRTLIGAHRPDSGSVKLFGKDIWSIKPKELDAVRKRFGILFQSGALFSSMSVGENVALPLKEHTNLSPEMIDLMVKVKLELVGLRQAEAQLPSEISGGMAKRAGLARAIALDPELLFYDEPTSGLDPIMTGIIDGLIVDLARTMNVTSVVVTHDLKSAFRVADRMVVLNAGRIVTQGMPHEIRACTDPFVKRFIQGPVEAKTAIMTRGSIDRGSSALGIQRPAGPTLVSMSHSAPATPAASVQTIPSTEFSATATPRVPLAVPLAVPLGIPRVRPPSSVTTVAKTALDKLAESSAAKASTTAKAVEVAPSGVGAPAALPTMEGSLPSLSAANSTHDVQVMQPIWVPPASASGETPASAAVSTPQVHFLEPNSAVAAAASGETPPLSVSAPASAEPTTTQVQFVEMVEDSEPVIEAPPSSGNPPAALPTMDGTAPTLLAALPPGALDQKPATDSPTVHGHGGGV